MNEWREVSLLINVHAHFSSVMSNCLWPHGLQHTRLPCLSLTYRACPNYGPSSQWCHPTVSSSVVPFSCPQSFSASESFPISRPFPSGGHSIGASASASVLPMNIQDWFPLGWTGLISLLFKGLSRVFSTAIQEHHSLALSLLYGPTLTSIHDYRKNHSLDPMATHSSTLAWKIPRTEEPGRL